MRITFAVVLCLLAVPAYADPQEKAYQWSLVAASAVHVADISTTSNCLGRGTCREANPALRWASGSSVGLGLAKGAMAGALHLMIHRTLWKRGHKWQAIAANVVVIGITGAVTARNTRF